MVCDMSRQYLDLNLFVIAEQMDVHEGTVYKIVQLDWQH